VKITLPEIKTDYKALLKVTLVDKKGKEYSASRIVWYEGDTVIENPNGSLASLITDPSSVRSLTLTGTITTKDLPSLRQMTSLEILDLSRCTLTTLPQLMLVSYDQTTNTYTSNTTTHTVILADGLTNIGSFSFKACDALRHINIPASVETIGIAAFWDAGLTEVVIPATVKTIESWAFAASDSTGKLQSMVIEAGGVTVIPDAFCYKQNNLTSVSLPDDITSIGDDAFMRCPLQVDGGLLVFPSKLKKIGKRAFSSFYSTELGKINNITALKFPNGLETIESSAFNNCNIPIIDLPASIKSLHTVAFHWHTVQTLICRADSVPEMPLQGDYQPYKYFNTVGTHVTLKVPKGSVDAYKKAWGEYLKEVVALDE